MLKFCRVFILTLLLGGLFVQQGYCADRYYWLGSNDTETASLDTQTFRTHKGSNLIYFDSWIQFQYNEAGVQEVISDRKRAGLPIAGYEKLSKSLYHNIYSLSQSRKMYKIIQYIYYDINGNVLESYTYPSSESFQDIVPGSESESTFHGILKYSMETGK